MRDNKHSDQDKCTEVIAVAGEVAISKRLLADSSFIAPLWLSYLGIDTPERQAKREAKRVQLETEWDVMTELGLVGITDDSDYEGGPAWTAMERGHYVEKWVTADAWNRYIAASHEFYQAESAL